mgnify:CR=1 FL=1
MTFASLLEFYCIDDEARIAPVLSVHAETAETFLLVDILTAMIRPTGENIKTLVLKKTSYKERLGETRDLAFLSNEF